MKGRKPSPRFFVKWALGGAALTWGGFLASFVILPRFGAHGGGFSVMLGHRLPLILAGLTPGAIGLATSFWAEWRLRLGLENGIWTDEEVTACRALLSGRAGNGAILAVLLTFVLSVAFVFWSSPHNAGEAVLLYILLLPLLTVTRIPRLLAPPVERNDGLQLRQGFKAMSSEHWGGSPKNRNAHLL